MAERTRERRQCRLGERIESFFRTERSFGRILSLRLLPACRVCISVSSDLWSGSTSVGSEPGTVNMAY